MRKKRKNLWKKRNSVQKKRENDSMKDRSRTKKLPELRKMELELKMKKIKTSAMLERLDDSKDEIGPVSGASRNTVKGPKMPCFEET